MACTAGYDWCGSEHVVYKEGDRRFCVFHAPAYQKGISVDEFNARVFSRLTKAITGRRECDLSGTIFPGDITFSSYKEKKTLPSVNFFSAHFIGNANFSSAQFRGDANFFEAHFSGDAGFDSAQFIGNANFFEAQLIGNAVFHSAQFSGDANFFLAQFSGFADFVSAQFKKADFDSAVFLEYVDFQSASFTETPFFGRLSHQEQDLKNPVHKNFPFLKGANFSEVSPEKRITFECVNLDNVTFLSTDIRNADFIKCDWPELKGHRVLYDEIQAEQEEDLTVRDALREKVGRLYRRLKQKYKDEHDEAEVSHWHSREKDISRKRVRPWPPGNFFNWLMLNAYNITRGYGEMPGRASVVLFLMLLCVYFFYGISGISAASTEVTFDSLENAETVLVNSLQIVTFNITRKYVPATNLGIFVALLFKALLPIQATLFAFALRNRYRR